MKILRRVKFFVIVIALLIIVGTNKDSVAGKNQDCWNLVAVKAEWKKKNSNGKYVKISSNGIKSHLSTDGSWQWVEVNDPSFSNGRVFINAGWSPPPKQYCYPGGEIGVSLKLTNKLVNSKIKGNVALLSWGNNHFGGYGNGRTMVSVSGSETGSSTTGKIRMHNGQQNLQQPASWMASVQIGNLRGQINYHYLPMGTKSQVGTKTSTNNSQVNTSPSSRNRNVAYLNANNDIFVRSLYYSILDRKPDEAGVRNWTKSLVGGKSRAWVITEFFRSPEYLNKRKNNTEYVRDLYQGVLGRQPDPSGLLHWVNLLNSGNSRHSVLNGFLNSKEYRSRTSRG
jgi:Domain of unknown function (DUF4214)